MYYQNVVKLRIGSPNITITRTFKLEVKFGVPLFTKLEPDCKRNEFNK
jgi:hypothetical protein